jgi:hypothetical protein
LAQREVEQRRACLHVDDKIMIHHEVKNDLDKVKANFENVLSSWESMGGLEIFQVPSIEVNTNHKIVPSLNVAQTKIVELHNNKLGLKIFFAIMHFEVAINKS